MTLHAQTTRRMANGQTMTSMLNFGAPSDPPADRKLELPLAPCIVSLWRDGFVGRSLAIDPSRPGAPTELTMSFLPAVATIALEARDEGDQPIAGAWVRVYRRRGGELEAIFSRDAETTDERGVCSLAELPRGECLVVAQAEGFAPAARLVTIVEDATADQPLPLDLTLERGYEVTLRPRLDDGTPVTYGQYSITTEDGAPLHDRFHPRSGVDRLDGKKLRLTDGRYTLRCAAAGLADGSITFIAAPGVEVVVELTPVR